MIYLSYRCPGCGYVYDEECGEPHEGFAAGTLWIQIPEDWACPACAVREKPDFEQEIKQPGSGLPVGIPALKSRH